MEAKFNNLPVMMVVTNSAQTIIDVNEEFVMVTGFSRDEFVGEASANFLLPEDKKVLAHLATEQKTVAEARGVPLRILCKNGDVLDVELFNQRSYDDEGEFVSSRNTLVDVTTRNNILRSKLQMRESMVEGNHALAEFSQIAANEMKQPLSMLESFLCMIREKAKWGSKSSQDLELLDFNLAKINALVDDLLILAQVNLDPEELRQVDLKELLEATVRKLEDEIGGSGAEVILEGEFPIVHITSSQLGIVMEQLLSNSLRYRSADRAPVIKIANKRVHNRLEIRLSDNGMGFDESECEFIFEAFSRVGVSDEYKSTGMGLAICRRVMDQLGGTISATGEPNVGSEFVLSFPDYANTTNQIFSAM